MSGRLINADDIMALLKKHGPVSARVHGLTWRILTHWYDADDDVSLVIALRGESKIPRSVQRAIGSNVLGIITRDAEAHFGRGINDQKTTLASAVLARALRQVSWGAVGNRVYRLTRERLLNDSALAERADKRAAERTAQADAAATGV
jgi:hypothetical protein